MRVDLIYQDVIPEKERKRYDRCGLSEREGVMIHRVGKDHETGADFGDTAEDICRAFTEGPAARYTGYKIPYSFIVQADGRVAQALPLSWVGPHALKLSRKWVAIAFIGDFRDSEPTPSQFVAGTILVRMVLGTLGLGVEAIEGHTSVPKASSNPAKKCPGKGFNLYEFKSAVTGGLAL